jgi:hypothetical protein
MCAVKALLIYYLENSQDFKDLLKTPVSSIEAISPGRAFHSLAEDAEKLLSPYPTQDIVCRYCAL